MDWTPGTLRHYDAQKHIAGSAASDAARTIRLLEQSDARAPEHKRGSFPSKLAGWRMSLAGFFGGTP